MGSIIPPYVIEKVKQKYIDGTSESLLIFE